MWKAVERAVLSTVVCREYLVVHSWQNGTRCRDGVNVLWCLPILFGWFLRAPSLHVLVFNLENFFVTCSCYFFLLFFRSSKREERQARGRCLVFRV